MLVFHTAQPGAAALRRALVPTLAIPIGAYAAYVVVHATGSLWLALPAGILGGIVFGALLERFLFRHFYKREHLDQVLLTFALILIFGINRAYFGWTLKLHWPLDALGRDTLLILLAAVAASVYPALRASGTPAVELNREDL